MSTIELEALIAGLVCGVIVAGFFIAMDINRSSAKVGAGATWAPPGEATSAFKQFETVVRPLTSRLPAVAAGQLREKLSRAGDPGNLTAVGFQAMRYGLAALLAIIGLTLGLLIPLPLPPLVLAPVAGAVLAAAGYMGPSIWLEFRISSRRRQIQRSLAEATDLLTLVVESGMSLDEGLLSITERFHNALGDEIGKVLREIRLGRPRMLALEHMAEVSGVPDLHHLVESIVQSDQMGVPIARLLRVQATEMRRRQRQTAQERAAQASSRMVFPMVGCIFPVLWIVLLGPALIQIFNTIGH
jgi:tight adherence protein C